MRISPINYSTQQHQPNFNGVFKETNDFNRFLSQLKLKEQNKFINSLDANLLAIDAIKVDGKDPLFFIEKSGTGQKAEFHLKAELDGDCVSTPINFNKGIKNNRAFSIFMAQMQKMGRKLESNKNELGLKQKLDEWLYIYRLFGSGARKTYSNLKVKPDYNTTNHGFSKKGKVRRTHRKN